MKKNKNRRHVGNKRYFWAMQPAPERLTLCWRRRMRQKSMELMSLPVILSRMTDRIP